MSYLFTDKDSDRISFSGVDSIETVVVSIATPPVGGGTVYIPNADVPTVAAELLKAAGIEATILPKRVEKVTKDGNVISCGPYVLAAHAMTDANPADLRIIATNCIALAEYLESKAAREADAEKKLQERRREIGIKYGYTSFEAIPGATLALIDRIIELEDEGANK